jgi:cytochrome c-type biogenesis protein
MTLLIVAFLAGVLTVAAPCILPLLPVIIGGTILRSGQTDTKISKFRPLIIAVSLGVSVIVFTLLLKASTALLGVPQEFWRIVSGVIVLLLGLNFLSPTIWNRLILRFGLEASTNKLLTKSAIKSGYSGDVLTGAALGPVFSSCSPTYAFIVAAVIPVSFVEGFVYLIAYALGLALALLIIGYAGQSVVRKMGWLSNPNGWFRRTVGILFIVVGIMVLFGWDKNVQEYVLEHNWYAPIEHLEQNLRH